MSEQVHVTVDFGGITFTKIIDWHNRSNLQGRRVLVPIEKNLNWPMTLKGDSMFSPSQPRIEGLRSLIFLPEYREENLFERLAASTKIDDGWRSTGPTDPPTTRPR